jgi:hypothetical protein
MAQGHKVSADTVGDLLRAEGFSLQGNAKTTEGAQHPDRDAQFRYISEQARACQMAGDPVISVDTKKKELVGDFANGGKEYRPQGRPVPVRTHDFMDKDLGKAIPYGVYDVAADAGWVNVGTDHDTAAFAVESIRRWWHGAGRLAWPAAGRLLITATPPPHPAPARSAPSTTSISTPQQPASPSPPSPRQRVNNLRVHSRTSDALSHYRVAAIRQIRPIRQIPFAGYWPRRRGRQAGYDACRART